jgi:eukaryotic-like serine/threonine-protein kinase
MASNQLTKIGKYDVVEVLGKGGMGIVYKAMDNRIGRLVAIKMMTGGFAENPDLLKRFYREAQSTGMLQHPNIVIVYDLGDQEGNPYLVMEYLEGEPLDKMIASRKPMTIVQKLDYIIQCCNGLNYAHQRGIVHRDIKPANLMILKDGQAKIVDFGIARIGDKSLTRTGQVVGTITYMSPEQINAQVVDGRTDIFSAGVMLYELLTNALPFDGKDTASTLLKIIHEPPPPLKNYMQDYPAELEEVLSRALAKDREERYATAEDFAFDLSRVQEQLKKTMVSDYVEKAKKSIEKEELSKAKELLQQVLKVDTQHMMAKELMHDVQLRLQRQQRSEQIRQLRSHAEDAMSHKQFEDALAYVEQALSLDKTSTELLNLRDLVQEAKTKKDKVEGSLKRAEAARNNDDLEAALEAIEKALEAEPENAQARAMHAAISKELAEQSKEKQVRGFLDEARRNISSRKFTAAFEVLKKAEQLDASSPEVHALMNLASSGREQETRRKDLDKYTTEIEDALNRDDYVTACAKADEALKRFANEPALLKLKALADKQRETGEKKKFLEEQMSAARKLLDTGKADEALSVLEKAATRVPGDTRLANLLAIVRDSAEREKTERIKSEFITKAKEALRRKDYAGAVKTLEQAQAQIEGSAEINDLLQFAKEEAQQQSKRKKIDEAAEQAQKLIAEEEYERAVQLLEATMKQTPDEELRVVLTDARRHVEEFNRKIESVISRANRLLDSRHADDAVALLESQPKAYAKSAEFCAALEKARGVHDQLRAVGAAVDKAGAAVEKGDFASALNILEACKKTYGETPEIKAAFAELDQKRVAVGKSAVEKAIRDARTLLLARQYSAALNALNAVAPLLSGAPQELQQQYKSLKNDAQAGASRQQKEADLGKTIVQGSAEPGGGGQTIVAGSYEAPVVAQPVPAVPVAPTAMAPAAAAPAPAVARPSAVAPARAKAAPAPPIAAPPAKKSMMPIIAAVAVVVLAIVGFAVYKLFIATPPATAYVEVNAIPWGTVKTITTVNGKRTIEVNQQTPVRVMLPPGDYKVIIDGPNGQEQVEPVNVRDDQPGSVTPVFDQIDVEKIVNEH